MAAVTENVRAEGVDNFALAKATFSGVLHTIGIYSLASLLWFSPNETSAAAESSTQPDGALGIPGEVYYERDQYLRATAATLARLLSAGENTNRSPQIKNALEGLAPLECSYFVHYFRTLDGAPLGARIRCYCSEKDALEFCTTIYGEANVLRAYTISTALDTPTDVETILRLYQSLNSDIEARALEYTFAEIFPEFSEDLPHLIFNRMPSPGDQARFYLRESRIDRETLMNDLHAVLEMPHPDAAQLYASCIAIPPRMLPEVSEGFYHHGQRLLNIARELCSDDQIAALERHWGMTLKHKCVKPNLLSAHRSASFEKFLSVRERRSFRAAWRMLLPHYRQTVDTWCAHLQDHDRVELSKLAFHFPLTTLREDDRIRLVNLYCTLPIDGKVSLLNLIAQPCPREDRDINGAGVLENLDAALQHATYQGLLPHRVDLITSAIKELADPGIIAQHHHRTCGPTAILKRFFEKRPAEASRILAGLASPSGLVELYDGAVLMRSDDGCQPFDRRSYSEALLQSALMEYCDGDDSYSNRGDVHYRVSARGISLDSVGIDIARGARLMQILFGSPFQYCFAGEIAWPELEFLLSQEAPIIARMRWGASDPNAKIPGQGHAISPLRISDGRVYFINPTLYPEYTRGHELEKPQRRVEDPAHGIESMTIETFKKEVTHYVLDAAALQRCREQNTLTSTYFPTSLHYQLNVPSPIRSDSLLP